MSELKKRKVPTPELKAKIGLEAIRGLKTLNEIAQDHGVHPVQVSQGVLKNQVQHPLL